MMSQTGQQIITIHILPNISRSKGNVAMKFGQLIKYGMKNIFLQNQLVLDHFLFFKKALDKVKTSRQQLNFNKFYKNLLFIILINSIKTIFITFQTVDSEICSVLIFRKESGSSFSTTFCT